MSKFDLLLFFFNKEVAVVQNKELAVVPNKEVVVVPKKEVATIPAKTVAIPIVKNPTGVETAWNSSLDELKRFFLLRL